MVFAAALLKATIFHHVTVVSQGQLEKPVDKCFSGRTSSCTNNLEAAVLISDNTHKKNQNVKLPVVANVKGGETAHVAANYGSGDTWILRSFRSFLLNRLVDTCAGQNFRTV